MIHRIGLPVEGPERVHRVWSAGRGGCGAIGKSRRSYRGHHSCRWINRIQISGEAQCQKGAVRSVAESLRPVRKLRPNLVVGAGREIDRAQAKRIRNIHGLAEYESGQKTEETREEKKSAQGCGLH